jgi:hypothetical protein
MLKTGRTMWFPVADFRLSHKYNIAAYQLAEIPCLDDIVPVDVERKWKGDSGSFSWWLPVKMG